jgi:4-amino-4-deoxy-L-arabinose transferase-like glycosyltransferase
VTDQSSTGEQRLSLREYLLLALFALAVFLPGLHAIPPVDRDEGRYVTASTQMLASGDFIDIRYQDSPRYKQPAGIYWLQTIPTALFSDPETREVWTYRVPSLLSAVAAVLTTGFIGALLFGRRAGIAAGALLAACFSLNFEARIAKVDATLLAAITAAQLALLLIYLDRAARPKATAALFWAMLGVGLMLKGPVILIVTLSTIAALCVWDRNVRWLGRLHAAWGAPLTLAVALPWFVAIGIISDGDFYTRSLGQNFGGKITTGQETHGGPAGYHLTSFLVMFWPGSLFAGLAVPFAWRERMRPEIRFLIAWIVPTWIVFELVATKLPHYVLPTYPAIACLAGAALFAGPQGLRPPWRIAGWVWAATWALAGLLLATLGVLFKTAVDLDLFDAEIATAADASRILSAAAAQMATRGDAVLIAAALGGAILVGMTLAFAALRRPERALVCALSAAAIVWIFTFGRALPGAEAFWLAPRIAETAERVRPCPTGELITTPYHEPSLVFLYGFDRTRLALEADAASRLARAPACSVAVIGAKQEPRFLADAARLGLTVRPAAELKGRNYSDNEIYDLTFYVLAARGTANGGS